MKPIALVTGGNHGIGRGIVLALAQRGFDVAFADITETEDTAVTRREVEDCGARVSFVAGDVASPERAEYCFSKSTLSVMVKILAQRLGEAGIACYEIRPDVIRTSMTAVAAEKYDRLITDLLTTLARWGETDDVGCAVP